MSMCLRPQESRRDDAPGAGSAAFNVAIRTVRLVPDHPGAAGGGRPWGRFGGGRGSTRLGEWRECVVKGDFLRLNAGNADLIETMAFDPAAGIALLEGHLERMGAARTSWALRSIAMPCAMPSMRCASIWMRLPKCGWSWPQRRPRPGSHAHARALCRAGGLRGAAAAGGERRLAAAPQDQRSRVLRGRAKAARGAGAGEALLLRDDGC
jgi:para-aminobenzoate synthetase/4-amino-4-deoxychorismate lyase